MADKIAWLGTPESRIISIRKFRKYIDTLPFEQAVETIKTNWDSGPRINKPHFDIAKVDQWPTPWDLFGQTTFCVNSQALGTFYTLLLSEHGKEHDIKLAIIEDIIQGEKAAIVLDDYPLTDYTVSSIVKREDILSKLGVDA